MAKAFVWERDDVSYCRCSDLEYTHSHCPCTECNGKAVSRSTEYLHWKIACDLNHNTVLSSTNKLESGDIDCSEHDDGDAATSYNTTYTRTTSTPDTSISTSIDPESASQDELYMYSNSTNSNVYKVGTRIDQSDFGSITCDELDHDDLPAQLVLHTSASSTDSNLYSVIDELIMTTDHDSICDEASLLHNSTTTSTDHNDHDHELDEFEPTASHTGTTGTNTSTVHYDDYELSDELPVHIRTTDHDSGVAERSQCAHAEGTGEADACTYMSIEAVVLMAILEAMTLTDKINGSQDDFMRILEYGKGLYCQGAGNSSLAAFWPQSWQSAIRLLEKHGYKNPKDYYVCLSDSHPCSFDIFDLPNSKCRLCGAQSSACIKYSYLSLRDKIVRWCQDSVFCQKMTAHWLEKDHWMYDKGGYYVRNEIWDGSRFAELAWFWDPSCEWVLPAFCPSCKCVVSGTT